MQNAASPMRWVLTMVDGQSYALPLAAVDRVLRMVEVTPLPGAPDVVEGVIDIQGEVVAIVSITQASRTHAESSLEQAMENIEPASVQNVKGAAQGLHELGQKLKQNGGALQDMSAVRIQGEASNGSCC